MKKAAKHNLDAFTIRRISVAGDGVDPRTVHAYLSGLTLRTTTRLRVERALREVGFAHLVRPARVAT